MIEYDADAETAVVQYVGKTQEWRDAKLTFAQGITETRDGYLLPLTGQQRTLILTGVPT
ncbi:hypothetical protein ACI2JN_01515 [Ochrobactrum teleogrylli]|uniref:hypothetical protein n=1 Tax=Ochrobactrum teleogrylli TaxID=2479765 RepID=UPI0038513B6C